MVGALVLIICVGIPGRIITSIKGYVPFIFYYEGNGYVVSNNTAILKEYNGGEIAAEVSYHSESYEVTKIGNNAFNGCESLTSIERPDSITEIEMGTFERCTSSKSIDLPDGVTKLRNSAFAECTSLESIEIPAGVTSIEYSTFNKCESMESIEIPDSVTVIDDYAFHDCSSLESIEVPEAVMEEDNNWADYSIEVHVR